MVARDMVTAQTAISLLDLGPDHLNFNSHLELNAVVNTVGRAGFVFDRYGDEGFKFAAIDAASDELIIGHYTQKSGWVKDAVFNTMIDAGTDYELGVELQGTTVSAKLNEAEGGGFKAMLGYAFNAAVVDGNFGLLATDGVASFDEVNVRTNDDAFIDSEPSAIVASSMLINDATDTAPAGDQIDSILATVMSQWTDVLGNGDARLAALGNVHVVTTELSGPELAFSDGNTITIDSDAAGHGWYVDASPASSKEFRIRLDDGVLAALPDSDAYGKIDLATVLAHEVGHLLGLTHNASVDYPVMQAELDPGIRFLLEDVGFDHDPDQPISNQTLVQLAMEASRVEEAMRLGHRVQGDRDGYAINFGEATRGTGSKATVDWNSDHSGWSGLLNQSSKTRGGSNLADFVSSVLSDDEGGTKSKTSGKEPDSFTSDSGFVVKSTKEKGWFDLWS